VTQRSWRRWLEPLADPVIALAVLVLSLLPLLRTPGCDCPSVSTWGYFYVAGQGLVLVWRRRWPFTVALMCGLLTVGYGLSSLPDPPVPYAGLVGLYTAAALASRRLARLAALLAAVGIAAAMVADWPNADFQDVTVTYLLFATAWLLGDGVPGPVVGVPRLRLKRQEDTDPLVLGRVVQQQPTVLPDAVVLAEALTVALIHVDVMNPVAGPKAEDLVRDPGFWPPALPEGIQAGSRVDGGAAHEVVQLVGQVVVGPGTLAGTACICCRSNRFARIKSSAIPPGWLASGVKPAGRPGRLWVTG